MSQIRINIALQVKQGETDRFIEMAKTLIQKSRPESGCIYYDLLQSTTDPSIVWFCETWQNKAALQAHHNQPHFQDLFPVLKAMSTVLSRDEMVLP